MERVNETFSNISDPKNLISGQVRVVGRVDEVVGQRLVGVVTTAHVGVDFRSVGAEFLRVGDPVLRREEVVDEIFEGEVRNEADSTTFRSGILILVKIRFLGEVREGQVRPGKARQSQAR